MAPSAVGSNDRAVRGHCAPGFHWTRASAPRSARAKQSIRYGLQTDLLTGYRFEIEVYNRLVDTDDRREGVRAFNEKRKPDFKGE